MKTLLLILVFTFNFASATAEVTDNGLSYIPHFGTNHLYMSLYGHPQITDPGTHVELFAQYFNSSLDKAEAQSAEETPLYLALSEGEIGAFRIFNLGIKAAAYNVRSVEGRCQFVKSEKRDNDYYYTAVVSELSGKTKAEGQLDLYLVEISENEYEGFISVYCNTEENSILKLAPNAKSFYTVKLNN